MDRVDRVEYKIEKAGVGERTGWSRREDRLE